MNKATIYSLVLIVAIAFLFFANLAWGSVNIPFKEVLDILTSSGAEVPHALMGTDESLGSANRYIILESRLPQAVCSCRLPFATPWLALMSSVSAVVQDSPLPS